MKNKIWLLFNQYDIYLEKDVFDYGWYIFCQYFFCLLVLIPLTILTESFFLFLFFILCFAPLRRYLGGFHFNKKFLCIFFSILFSILIILLSKYVIFNNTISILLFIFSTIFCITIGPVEHKNKQITDIEKEINKKKSIFFLMFLSLIFIILNHLHIEQYANICFLTLIFFTVNLILTKYKKKE